MDEEKGGGFLDDEVDGLGFGPLFEFVELGFVCVGKEHAFKNFERDVESGKSPAFAKVMHIVFELVGECARTHRQFLIHEWAQIGRISGAVFKRKSGIHLEFRRQNLVTWHHMNDLFCAGRFEKPLLDRRHVIFQ